MKIEDYLKARSAAIKKTPQYVIARRIALFMLGKAAWELDKFELGRLEEVASWLIEQKGARMRLPQFPDPAGNVIR